METQLIQGNYKIFNGKYHKQMPLLIQEGFRPLTAKQVMEYRLKAIKSKDKNEMDFWLKNYFDTVDGLAFYDNKLIVVPNSQLLLNISQKSRLNDDSLILKKEQFKELGKQYGVIPRKDIFREQLIEKENVKQHPIWIKLAQNDKHLLNEYTDAIFEKQHEEWKLAGYPYDPKPNKNMGIYLPGDENIPLMHQWYLSCPIQMRHSAFAWGEQWFSGSHLLGISAKNLEKVVQN